MMLKILLCCINALGASSDDFKQAIDQHKLIAIVKRKVFTFLFIIIPLLQKNFSVIS